MLSIQPQLLSKSIVSVGGTLKSWEPTPSAEYLGVVRYLCHLLQAAAVDGKVKAQLRLAFAAPTAAPAAGAPHASNVAAVDAKDAQSRKQHQQSAIMTLLNSWIPPGICSYFPSQDNE